MFNTSENDGELEQSQEDDSFYEIYREKAYYWVGCEYCGKPTKLPDARALANGHICPDCDMVRGPTEAI